MINNQEKIELLINKLNNIQGNIDSYIAHAYIFKDKYSLEDVLPNCNAIKLNLIKELEALGGVWSEP